MNEEPEFTSVNEFYWAYWAKKYIDGSSAQIDTDLTKLQTVIDWAIGLVTISSFISASFSGLTDNAYLLIILCVPLPLLIIARFFSTVGVKYDVCKFDPRVPSSIMEAYNKLMDTKLLNLTRAKMVTGLAFISLAVGLGMYYILKNRTKNPYVNSLKLSIRSQDDKFDALGISGYLKDSTLIHLTVSAFVKPNIVERVIEKHLYFFNSPDKQFFTGVLVDCTAYKYSVNLEWPDTLSSGFLAMRMEIDRHGKIIESTKPKTKITPRDTIPQDPAAVERVKGLINSLKPK
ncbi:hypothetical protein [Dyadobacter frigoris]|uniref:Uncharacterized protein n=1 Tax=Dyadobacter frigoris TaxID=2576211 RepID=A0A4U6DDY4_9BACT|nr:hypothetical protein [Dyadobacter frigoris]TKT92674.1 hypothetical protein FDK13_07625 [Dyadobacter frigoris]